MKVILIDDDPLVLRSLETILTAQGVTVAATSQRGTDALSLYRQHRPDVVLLDIRMPDLSGIDVSDAILAENPKANILLLTTFQDEEYLTRALNLGCKGYLLKQNVDSLVPSLNAVLAGNTVLDAEILPSLRLKTPAAALSDDLTEREKEILAYVAEGLNNKEIAAHLYLSEGTVRNYVSQLLEKLNLRDRTQLAIYYYRKG